MHCWNDFDTTPVDGLDVLVLFDGAGFAARGLLNSGITANGGSMTCVELDPDRVYLARQLNPGVTHITADIFDLDINWIAGFDAVWASPPCQKRSGCTGSHRDVESMPQYERHDDMLAWSLALPNDILWVENVIDNNTTKDNSWGKRYTAAQFEKHPRQLRQRLIGGRYRPPYVWRPYRQHYRHEGLSICPAITGHNNRWTPKVYPSGFIANEAANFYGRGLSVTESAWHQGLDRVPDGLLESWFYNPNPDRFTTWNQWREFLYQAIGNAVPVYMAEAFGRAYSAGELDPLAARQLALF